MAGKLDQIIVVDVESTSWAAGPPAGEESEIIEVGVCTLDVASNERGERRSILVRPKRSRVSDYCRELTTLTQDQVDRGVSFAESCDVLKHSFESKHRTWASWGDYDRRQFERQCAAENIKYPFGPTHINVKNLFAITHNLRHEIGMAGALEIMKLPLDGTHHRGADDAWNIAAILSQLIMRAKSS